MDIFGMSVPQASKGLTLHQERAPANAVYDQRAKPDFTPIFVRPDPGACLARLRSRAEGRTEAGA